MTSYIQSGKVEPIQVFAVDKTGSPLTGLGDLYVKFRRDSDGWFLDWNDLTFKALGHTTLNQPLTELDATNVPGVYEVIGGLDFSAVTNIVVDDIYLVIPLQTPGTTAVLPGPSELKVGHWADVIDDTKAQADKIDQAATIGPAAVTSGSLLDRIANKDSGKTYNQATDSLEAIKDRTG